MDQNISLKQGKLFKKKSIKEGLTNNTADNSSSNVDDLEKQFATLSQEYNTLLNDATKNSLNILSRSNPTSDKYVNKFVSFNNANGYVTNKGVFKWIESDSILDSLSGKNGCPNKKDIVKINADATGYNIPGTEMNNLLVGTPMVQGQTCGNEGSNVFVSSVLDNPTTSYKGCFKDDSSLTYLDGVYSLDQCKSNAIYGGYKYFGLQNVDPVASTGKCVLTNDYSKASNTGTSYKVTKTVPLWFSSTGGSSGVSAVLSLQATLNVVNANGATIFSTPNAQKQPTNYIGCYGDTSNRSMIPLDNASHSFNYDTCKQSAVNGNYSLFALQDSTTGNNAACFVSNDLSQSTKYGLANNCTTLSNGIVSGGAWSNALYNTVSPANEYFLQVLDNGNMVIYLGASPEQKQSLIWQSGTTGKSPNPNYKAAAGKYGRDYIKIGEPLGVNEFVGSVSGSAFLIMQFDGNLVLYTSDIETNCQKMKDGNMGGGLSGNALYELSATGDKSVIGKLAFVDDDGLLNEYPESMQQYTTEYIMFPGQNSLDNDIKSAQVSGVEECQKLCNDDALCSGIAYQSSTNTCYTKNNGTFPNADLVQDATFSFGLRKKQPVTEYCSTKSVNIDSNAYLNYKKGKEMTSDKRCNESLIDKETKNKLDKIKVQMNELGQKIADKLGSMYKANTNYRKTINDNTVKFNGDLDEFDKTVNKIRREFNDNNIASNNIEGMQIMAYNDLNGIQRDTQLYVLQQNYSYIAWGLLAVGVAAITLNKLTK